MWLREEVLREKISRYFKEYIEHKDVGMLNNLGIEHVNEDFIGSPEEYVRNKLSKIHEKSNPLKPIDFIKVDLISIIVYGQALKAPEEGCIGIYFLGHERTIVGVYENGKMNSMWVDNLPPFKHHPGHVPASLADNVKYYYPEFNMVPIKPDQQNIEHYIDKEESKRFSGSELPLN